MAFYCFKFYEKPLNELIRKNLVNKWKKKYNFLRPIKNENLVRLGRNADGGYVVDKNVVENTNHLVTFGLGPDWSFELDYIKLNNKSKNLNV